jgi:hypothetical protein
MYVYTHENKSPQACLRLLLIRKERDRVRDVKEVHKYAEKIASSVD